MSSYNDDFSIGKMNTNEWLNIKNEMLLRKFELEHEELVAIESVQERWKNMGSRRKAQLLKDYGVKTLLDFSTQEIAVLLEVNGMLITLSKRIE